MEKEARDLLDGPPGTNPEYERGMCELIANVALYLGRVPPGDTLLPTPHHVTSLVAKKVAKEVGAGW
jgi:hypothetical protein